MHFFWKGVEEMGRASVQAKVQASESRGLGSQGNSLKTGATNDVLAQAGLDTKSELPPFHILNPAVKILGLAQT